jgi:hypothetical protein
MDDLKRLLDALKTTPAKEISVSNLDRIEGVWSRLERTGNDISPALEGNQLFNTLSDMLGANVDSWRTSFPPVISDLVRMAIGYHPIFPADQTYTLAKALRRYVRCKYWEATDAFCMLCGLPLAQKFLLDDDETYHTLKNAVVNKHIGGLVFMNITNACEEWQLKILQDKSFVFDLLSLEDKETVWGIFFNLVQHPDAKTLLPGEVLTAASKDSSYLCKAICALLTNDDDLSKLNLDNKWIDHMVDMLKLLTETGDAEDRYTRYNLLDLLLPIANLSVPEAFKETLGSKVVDILLHIVTEELPKTPFVEPFLLRGRQEASRALWNFAYTESNRKLIAKANGKEKLQTALKKTSDSIVLQNINGILHMLNPDQPHQGPKQVQQKHVMISYNWANQPTVLKLAKSLQQRGYAVWLDVEQMNGSTLEAMAHAIEQSDLVLICMSQKYKDSPNCRLEGEYCVNSKIKFLPLMMQPNYKPDGWLGITLGSKLYYDFTNESNWDAKLDQLVKAMGNLGKAQTSSAQETEVQKSQPEKSPVNWDEEDMRKWFENEHIYRHYHTFKKHKFNGRALLELKCHLGNPVFFSMCKELGIAEYGEIFQLSAAFRKL